MEKQNFEVKDSGKRQEFKSSMVRDTQDGKIQYGTVPWFLIKRLGTHLSKALTKYPKWNWLKGSGEEELDRYYESFNRHFYQWIDGHVDEDHWSASIFNLCGMLWIKMKHPKVFSNWRSKRA